MHLQEQGFIVDERIVDPQALMDMRAASSVPRALESCHTATVGGYVVEGHVPAADIRRLLADKPEVVGLAVPGMPVGSPGMEMGDQKEPYAVLTFDREGKTAVFARH